MIGRFDLQTTSRNQFVDITPTVTEFVKRSGVKSGVCFIYTPHTTAGVTINENADPSVRTDIIRKLGDLVPHQDNFQHLEGNSDSHIKSSLVGCSTSVIIDNGALVLGTWQGIFFCEFDGKRLRQFLVKIIEG